jgi:hypothetical protein
MSGMADIIAAHQPGNMSRERYCTCGAFIGDWATLEDLTAHMAEELVKAGYGDQHQAWEAGGEAAIERENTYGAEAKAKFSNPYPKGRS